MRFEKMNDDVLLIHAKPKADHRGWFAETFQAQQLELETGAKIEWLQDCRFYSARGALRGPHFYPIALGQYKLVECVRGRVLDVAICIDRKSIHFGRHVKKMLSEGSFRSVLVPPGYAHAVLALEPSVVQYKTNVGNRADVQTALDWSDPALGVKWPIEPSLLSREKTIKLEEVPGE